MLLRVISVHPEPDDRGTCWSFAKLFGIVDKVDMVLLRTQTTAILAWLETIKTMDILDQLLPTLPDALYGHDACLRLGSAELLFLPVSLLHKLHKCICMGQLLPARIAPKPGPPSLETSDNATFANDTGLNTQLLVDLQRVVACVLIRESEKDKEYVLSNAARLFFRDIASYASCSSRMTLLTRQTPWKQHGLVE